MNYSTRVFKNILDLPYGRIVRKDYCEYYFKQCDILNRKGLIEQLNSLKEEIAFNKEIYSKKELRQMYRLVQRIQSRIINKQYKD